MTAVITVTPPIRRSGSLSRRRRLGRVWGHVIIIIFGVALLYPLLWMLASSFKPNADIFSEAGLWPKNWTLQNYMRGWTQLGIPFSTFFLNSFLVEFCSVIGNLFSCSLAAYAFARLRFRLQALLFAIMISTIMLPFQVVLVPQYILFHTIN